jgi:hypothetical protein
MSGPRRFRAPAGDGDVLADPPFADVPRLVEENRRRLNRPDVMIGGLPLPELRTLARREVLPGSAVRKEPVDAPLLLAGHQPELSHPGVWAKHFALSGLARHVGGIPLNLIVDNDTMKSAALRVPRVVYDPRQVTSEAVPFDRFDAEEAYESRRIHDPACFESFADRVATIMQNWGYTPLLQDVWPGVVADAAETIGRRFTNARHEWERRWGCFNLEMSVSRLAGTESFRRFGAHVLADLPRFANVYNAAIRAYRAANGIDSANHPAPDLADGEAPFWVRSVEGRRSRSTAASDVRQLRPRALTLTLYARVCLGDFFVHGIGGGKYDEVTDAIIRDYFGIDPPAYQVVSATLRLPLPREPAPDVREAERRVRDLHWNPQRHLTAADSARTEVRALLDEKAALVTAEPPFGDRAARRAWFRALQSVTERLRPFVAEQVTPAEAASALARTAANADAVLGRRDYSWVLYPEATLRPFLQRFLDV